MATIRKLPSGNWRVQVRRKGRYIAETFRRHKEAEAWTLDMERRIDQGEVPSSRTRKKPTTFGDLIDLHLAALQEVGRSQSRTPDPLRQGPAQGRCRSRNRRHGLSYIKTIITHAAAVHGIAVSPEAVDLARTALKYLSIVGRSRSVATQRASSRIGRVRS